TELAALCQDPSFIVRLVSVKDQFGHYGIVGAFLLEQTRLDTFVLSCRALGRNVEECMLAHAFELAGGKDISAVLEALPRNEPARRLFMKLGCQPGVASTLSRVAWPAHVHVV